MLGTHDVPDSRGEQRGPRAAQPAPSHEPPAARAPCDVDHAYLDVVLDALSSLRRRLADRARGQRDARQECPRRDVRRGGHCWGTSTMLRSSGSSIPPHTPRQSTETTRRGRAIATTASTAVSATVGRSSPVVKRETTADGAPSRTGSSSLWSDCFANTASTSRRFARCCRSRCRVGLHAHRPREPLTYRFKSTQCTHARLPYF